MKLNQSHTPSIFNLACNYEKLEDFPKAKKWFLHAIKVKEDWPDAYYGLALTCVRLYEYEEACKYIELAVKWSGDNITPHVLYSRALCHRQNVNNELAQKHYQVIMRSIDN